MKIIASGVALLATLVVAAPASAAAPDGPGPWADTVVSYDPAPRKNGTPVPPSRNKPAAALGVAENNDVEGTFVSLGFGGKLVLGFDNNICNVPGQDASLLLTEVTRGKYPIERVRVAVSSDGVTFVDAGEVSRDGGIDLPDSVQIARFVKLTDSSDITEYSDGIADGYDVDGVRAVQTNCSAEGRMTGGGNFLSSNYGKVTHGFTLRCDLADKPNNLTVTWKDGGRTQTFKLEALSSILCTDDPAIEPPPPAAPFDTYQAVGTGKVNQQPGYDIRFVFSDAGEPGKDDKATIQITGPSGATVLDTTYFRGNHQAHDS